MRPAKGNVQQSIRIFQVSDAITSVRNSALIENQIPVIASRYGRF
jgi:hypothetical protein